MKKVLLYHIFPVNNWKAITEKLISDVPHDDIFIHVSLHADLGISEDQVRSFLRSFNKTVAIFFSENSTHPEVDAMEIFRSKIDFSKYTVLTYMHSKGVTNPDSQNIKDWIDLMHFFVIHRMSYCEKVFRKGYLLYGVNKTRVTDEDVDFKGASFFYAGNFVSVNLKPGMIEKLKVTPLTKSYYGLEGFWGKLCPSQLAYNAFHSRINHYLTAFPERYYKTWIKRKKYSFVSFCYHHYYIFRHRSMSISKTK